MNLSRDNHVFSVSPDTTFGTKLAALLAPHEVDVQAFSCAEDFLQAYPAGCGGTCCVLIDADLPGVSGLLLVQQLRARGFAQPLVFLVEIVDRELRRRAMASGATVVIEKPVAKAFLVTRLALVAPDENNFAGPPVRGLELRDGTLVTFRLMHPDDAEMMQQFVRDLSPHSQRMRFFSSLTELSPSMLEQFTNPHYPNTYAITATINEAGRERQIAVVRYEKTETDGVVEFAITVADDWQGYGLASEMLRGLIAIAAVAGVKRLQGSVMRENYRMLRLAKALGFSVSANEGDDDPDVVCVAVQLRD